MDIKISKGDILWSYLAQFFNMGAGLITLPVILKMLSAEEVGLNYILLTITSIVAIFDMGFSSQFSRNITYVLSGAQSIEKEGISHEYSKEVNKHLLACVIRTAKKIYKIIALLAFSLLLSLGTIYIWRVTNRGQSVDNVILIWLFFCFSCFFNLYFLYISSFLQGKGLIKEAKQGQVYSKIAQIAITFALLFSGFGLISVIIANLISPFVYRFYAQSKFYDSFIKEVVADNHITRDEIKVVFSIMFHNAKKMGIIGILTSVIGYASTLILGVYMSLADVGSYGVMLQIINFIGTISTTTFYATTPKLGQIMVRQELGQLKRLFGISQFLFISLQLAGLVGMLLLPPIFHALSFNTQLPAYYIIVIFYLYRFFEQNQSMYSQLLLIQNDMIFFKSNVLTGIISIALLFAFLSSGFGLLGVALSQCIPLLAYNAWKWPIYSCQRYNINLKEDILQKPFVELSDKVKSIFINSKTI